MINRSVCLSLRDVSHLGKEVGSIDAHGLVNTCGVLLGIMESVRNNRFGRFCDANARRERPLERSDGPRKCRWTKGRFRFRPAEVQDQREGRETFADDYEARVCVHPAATAAASTSDVGRRVVRREPIAYDSLQSRAKGYFARR